MHPPRGLPEPLAHIPFVPLKNSSSLQPCRKPIRALDLASDNTNSVSPVGRAMALWQLKASLNARHDVLGEDRGQRALFPARSEAEAPFKKL